METNELEELKQDLNEIKNFIFEIIRERKPDVYNKLIGVNG